MKPIAAIGLLLIVLGIVALAIPTFTYFSTDRVADTGYFHIDVSRPHTIVINPIAGVLAVAAGVIVMLSGRRGAIA